MRFDGKREWRLLLITFIAGALEFALEKLGKGELSLKEAGKDTICILPTGYGKSLIYQLLPHVFDYFLSSEEDSSSIILGLPLNALMQDQNT